MLGRLILKICIFLIIILYFSFYGYKKENYDELHENVAHLSTLFIQEQQLLKDLNIPENNMLKFSEIDFNHLPYIDGKLVELKHLTDHITSAKINITHHAHPNIKSSDNSIEVIFTGLAKNSSSLTLGKKYRWLVEAYKEDTHYYYLQGGLQGVFILD